MMKIFITIIYIFFINTNLFARQKPVQPDKPKPAMGLRVQPGGMLIQHVKLGQTYDIYEKSGVALIVENKDIRPHSYAITTSRPSEVGNKKWLGGYSEIPDPGWFLLETNEITVGPQDREDVKMYIKIPKEEKYYNQRWTVSLGVIGKHGKGDMLALAVYPRYQIETESKTGLSERPDGLTGLEPSMLIFKNVDLEREGKIIIHNNDDMAHKYEITAKVIDSAPTREQITNTPGYSWIPNIKWVRPEKERIEIKPGEKMDMTVSVKIPPKEEYSKKKWEALIFVSSEEGISRFARVRIETRKSR